VSLLKPAQEQQDLCLDRHVEDGNRLVGHHQVRADRERAGDADALALPSSQQGGQDRVPRHGVMRSAVDADTNRRPVHGAEAMKLPTAYG
jgi:hypothetical protein